MQRSCAGQVRFAVSRVGVSSRAAVCRPDWGVYAGAIVLGVRPGGSSGSPQYGAFMRGQLSWGCALAGPQVARNIPRAVGCTLGHELAVVWGVHQQGANAVADRVSSRGARLSQAVFGRSQASHVGQGLLAFIGCPQGGCAARSGQASSGASAAALVRLVSTPCMLAPPLRGPGRAGTGLVWPLRGRT